MTFLTPKITFLTKKKAPAATRQLEENGFSHFSPKKRRLRQHASRRKMVSATKTSYPIISYSIFWQNLIKISSKHYKKIVQKSFKI